MITSRRATSGQFSQRLIATSRGFRWLLGGALVCAVVGLAACEKSESPSSVQTSSSPSSGSGPSAKYQLGTVIRFGAGGGSERFRQSGWSETEPNATWTTGTSAKISIPLESTKQPLNLRMSLASLGGIMNKTPPGSAPVEVMVNGEKIADWDVYSRADFNAAIPASLVKDGAPLIIELRTPRAASPKSFGLGDDGRALGVYCFELALTASS